MGLSEHRDVLPLLGIVVELFYQFLQERVIDILQGFLDAQGDAGVVDVLRGQSEVDELLEAL